MSLVLAVRCFDGVVLASDGLATSDAAGQPTSTPIEKLFDLGGRLGWGATGCVGLRQTVEQGLEELDVVAPTAHHLRKRLAALVIGIQQRALSQWVPHPASQPPELACIFCWWQAG